jgi:hypothetical protein
MDKILEKIYSEKDLSTNIAIFFGALAFLATYINFDKDPYLALVALLSVFSITKVVSAAFINKTKAKQSNDLKVNSYSETEQKVISVFVDNGICFLEHNALQRGKYEVDEDGLDSLVARGVVEFIDGSFAFHPTGFQLNEEVYKVFLQRKALETLKK